MSQSDRDLRANGDPRTSPRTPPNKVDHISFPSPSARSLVTKVNLDEDDWVDESDSFSQSSAPETTSPPSPRGNTEHHLRRALEEQDPFTVTESDNASFVSTDSPVRAYRARASIQHNAPMTFDDRPLLAPFTPSYSRAHKPTNPPRPKSHDTRTKSFDASGSPSPTRNAFAKPAEKLLNSKSVTRLVTMFHGNRKATNNPPSPAKSDCNNDEHSTSTHNDSSPPTESHSQSSEARSEGSSKEVGRPPHFELFAPRTKEQARPTFPPNENLKMDKLVKQTYLKDLLATEHCLSKERAEAVQAKTTKATHNAPKPRDFQSPRRGVTQSNGLQRKRREDAQPIGLTFDKKPLGPQLNPNPLFFRSIPPGYHEGMPQFYEWLAKRDMLRNTPGGGTVILHPDLDRSQHRDSSYATTSGTSDWETSKSDEEEQAAEDPQERSLCLDGTDERELDTPFTPSGPSSPSSATPLSSPVRHVSFSPDVIQTWTHLDGAMTPSRVGHHFTSLIGSPSDRQGDTGTSIVTIIEPLDMDRLHITPIIIQAGRRTATRNSDQDHTDYKRPWGKIADPFEKLAVDNSLEGSEEAKSHGGLLSRLPQELSEAVVPEGSPNPENSGSTKLHLPFTPKHNTSFSSLRIPSPTRDVDIDRRPIYLTPQDRISQYPKLGTVEYYKTLKFQPFFAFDKNGYISRSKLTTQMISLFRDPVTAPGWASTIPDYYGMRAADKTIDLPVDPWVHYWETLVVKADIRRGCQLAVTAAEILAPGNHENMGVMTGGAVDEAEGAVSDFGMHYF